MPTAVTLILMLAASYVLVRSVKVFIESASKLARHFGISEYTISFLLVALATSFPEIIVGVTSALEKNPILSFGNVIGANTANITIIMAIPILATTGISTRAIFSSKDAYYSLFFTTLPMILIIDGVLTRLDGIILLSAYGFYFIATLKRSNWARMTFEKFEGINIWREAVLFLGSLLFLLAASTVIVKSAFGISSQLGLSLGFIGLSITALGTTLPEMAFSITAAKKHHPQEILGDVVGSVIANSTVVLGITSIIYPISINNTKTGFSSLTLLFFILLVFLRYARTKGKIDKFEALVLLGLYIIFLAVEYCLQGI